MNAQHQVAEIIVEMISSLPQAPREVSLDTNIARDLGLDSLAVMNFVMAIEDRFDVSVPMDKLAEVETIRDLADVITDLKGR
ncbi:acyl carrier protein [Arenibaculum pallidiluteum]|nr:acyl carrier protein [Arenibaculum pallidiluteum]